MKIEANVSLKAWNTFGLTAVAERFSEIGNKEELQQLIAAKEYPRLILGGGSNVLLPAQIKGLVLKNSIKGIEIAAEDENYVWIKAAAGEVWHDFVAYCIKKRYGGIENMALIPGNTGASPMQNIGAYGVEIKDVFHSLTALHIRENKWYTFSAADCEFGYRESIFKRKYKGEFIITDVTYRLMKQPVLNLSYKALADALNLKELNEVSIEDVFNTVIEIREAKLPDIRKVGSAGSFFKNPVIATSLFESLKNEHTQMPGYIDNGGMKVPAGWLIEQCGWKGYRNGDAGIYPMQALVLVNYGNALADEIRQLALDVQKSVQNRFGITIEPEVNIID